MTQFSEDIQNFLKNEYPNVDIDNMSLEDLKSFKEELINKRQEYTLLELAQKTLGNAAYGAAASPYFYFFDVNLAADITGECRNLTKTMWQKTEEFSSFPLYLFVKKNVSVWQVNPTYLWHSEAVPYLCGEQPRHNNVPKGNFSA